MHLNFHRYDIFICYSINTVIMSNLEKLKITALGITESNHMVWTVGAKLHLRENELCKIIDKLKTISDE